LNKYRQLKSFLKDGEAESYHGVSVEYVKGRKAVMTIYNAEEEEQESINLHEINDKDTLHALFREKGFVQKSQEDESTEAQLEAGEEGAPQQVEL